MVDEAKGEDVNSHTWTDDDVDLVARLLRFGRSVNEIADIMKLTTDSITGAIHRYGLVNLQYAPKPPTVQGNGAYCPIDLERYLTEATNRNVMPRDIALHLGVPAHRIIYMLGEGRPRLREKAAEKELFQKAERLLRQNMEGAA